MSYCETQTVELVEKLKTSEDRHDRNDALLRELMSAREDILRRGRETPAGAEELEEGGTEDAAAGSPLETVAGDGDPPGSAIPASGMVQAGTNSDHKGSRL